jgi:hypothetical protein
MFTKLFDTNRAAIFTVLVLSMPVGVALLIRIPGLTGGMGMWPLSAPTVAILVVLLVLTWDGYSREG